MPLQSVVVRGLPMEVEEELNKFFATHDDIRIVQLGQSESGNNISVTLVVEFPDPLAR